MVIMSAFWQFEQSLKLTFSICISHRKCYVCELQYYLKRILLTPLGIKYEYELDDSKNLKEK